MFIRLKFEAEITVPMYIHGLCAGFPSPADDYLDEAIDLTKLLVRNPPATFLIGWTATPCATPAFIMETCSWWTDR
ncbi:peptidase S24/S26 domain-containing protein [Brucella intermedia M86]|uniref:Peptidase S24/S26 domain-containing protein n=1 Tax=Brucella intermedia M86 TaxID=1234597 RepID=M5JK48_9HYPH|nr:peptidase S24/S26 domain-containing protein [Brucella intermedia M86]